MSSDDNHRRVHMMPTARNICTCAIFTTSSFNFGLPTYLFHTIVTEGYYMLFSIEEFFFKKVEQSCLTVVWQMTCQRSHRCCCASCWHHFASLVCFASFKNLILSGFARGWCHFPSRRLPYASICLS